MNKKNEKLSDSALAPLVMREIQERLRTIKSVSEQRHLREQQQDFQDLKNKFFPDWPDDRRATPNAVVRSGLFGVVGRGRRQRIEDMPVAGPPGWNITVTGWRLDQYDFDIWLEVMHLARCAKPGEEVRFTLHSILKRLGRSGKVSKSDYIWIEQRLKDLAVTIVSFENERYYGVMGSLLGSFWIDRNTGEGVVRTNPDIRPLFESITHLDIEQRRSLGSQLEKAMHAILSSHAEWIPMRLDTLIQRIGVEYSSIRFFKRDLRRVLDGFVQRALIHSFEFTTGIDGELLSILKVPTPTQLRAIEKRLQSTIKSDKSITG